MEVRMEESWKTLLKEEFDKDYFIKLAEFIRSEYKSQIVYPPARNIFSAFDNCPLDKLKVVILGQDPYHGAGQANGLCFSVNDGIAKPPSLQNIFKEINKDLGKPIPENGNLERWARQGVLLLNATLTVRANQAGSHQKKGWESFTDAVIEKISQKCENIVFILWGAYAQSKSALVNPSRHLILKSPHPSPLSAHNGFFGNRHFSRTNEYLSANGITPVDW
ncbi:MAG: uracil-DNA glycosylase [Bacteroidales bacterium]